MFDFKEEHKRFVEKQRRLHRRIARLERLGSNLMEALKRAQGEEKLDELNRRFNQVDRELSNIYRTADDNSRLALSYAQEARLAAKRRKEWLQEKDQEEQEVLDYLQIWGEVEDELMRKLGL